MTICVSLLILHTLISLLSDAFAADVMCRESDKAALLTFKNDLEDSGGRLSSWRGGVNCCEWTGVVCDNTTGQVRELRLRNPYDDPCAHQSYDAAQFEDYFLHRFRGKLNPSLLNVESLTHLDLSCNDFEGARLPDFISFLRNLQYLDLSSSGFHGAVPPQIANLSHLRYLNLGDPFPLFDTNLIIESVNWLSHLSKLQQLDLTGVNVTGVDNWVKVLETLPSLIELRLSRCGLKPIISNYVVTNFTNLSLLDISWNDFDSAVPQWIHNLTNLVHLDLSHCGFHSQIPSGLQNLNKLEYLNLSSNNFTSTFPIWFGKLSQLEILAAADNLIEGELPTTVGNLTSLRVLDLSQNRMEGMLPQSLTNLCNLEEMYLYINKFSGNLPSFTGCILNSLRFLYLGWNKFSGSFPSNLEHAAKLRELDLTENNLTGPLPTSLGQFHELEFLVITDNFLEGVVTESHFRNLSRLKIFRANGNRFVFKPSRDWIPPLKLEGLTLRSWQLGPQFPLWIRHLQHLQYLSFASTGIADSIPPWFWTLTSKMKYLNFSGNMITGQIPSLLDIGMTRNVAIDMKRNLMTGPLPSISSNVTILDLSSNLFSGSMNHFLCQNAEQQDMRLEILDLANNTLSGEIPDCWENWPSVSVVRLQYNSLTGKIPTSVGFLPRLHSLHLRRNNLSGEMPVSLQKCSNLMVLDLGLNHLKGLVPVWIHQLSGLVVLNLRLNEFWGGIPVELCRLSSLQALDLAGNNLSGRIPACLDGFKVMAGFQEPARRLYYSAEDTFGGVPDSQFLVVKGRYGLYSNILHWVMTMDLSDNALTGLIPVEITFLHKLQALNLSSNSLTGRIPENIGGMNLLESLDLSKNKLSGRIPQSLADLTFLSNLNLSYNNLTGRIPSSTQLEGFDASGFMGNELCGPPMAERCDEEEGTGGGGEDEERETSVLGGKGLGFLVSVVLGFAVGFWTVISSLVLNMSWRSAYFGWLTSIENYVYNVCVKCLSRLLSMLRPAEAIDAYP